MWRWGEGWGDVQKSFRVKKAPEETRCRMKQEEETEGNGEEGRFTVTQRR